MMRWHYSVGKGEAGPTGGSGSLETCSGKAHLVLRLSPRLPLSLGCHGPVAFCATGSFFPDVPYHLLTVERPAMDAPLSTVAQECLTVADILASLAFLSLTKHLEITTLLKYLHLKLSGSASERIYPETMFRII